MDNYEKLIRKVDEYQELQEIPEDYKETVDYVLTKTGIRIDWADIIMRYFGITHYNKPQSRKIIAEVYGIKEVSVRDKVERALRYGIVHTQRRTLLMLGLSRYKEERKEYDIVEEAVVFQTQYQTLEQEIVEMQEQRKKLTADIKTKTQAIETLAEKFADKHNTIPERAQHIGAFTGKLTMLHIDAMMNGRRM